MGVADMKKIMEMIEPLLLPIHTRKLINSKATKVLLSGAAGTVSLQDKHRM